MTGLKIEAFLTYGTLARGGKAMAAVLLAVALIVGPVGRGQAEEVRIIAFGDSLTAGYGLPADQGLVPQLQGWLDGQGAEVIIVQAGVSGETTAGGLARLDWVLGDDLGGVILELGANDILRGIAPDVARANLTAMLEICRDRKLKVLLVGVPVASNFGPDYQAGFLAIWPDLADAFDTLLYPNLLAALGDTPAEALTYLQGDGLHPTADGVARIVEAFGPRVQELAARIEQDNG